MAEVFAILRHFLNREKVSIFFFVEVFLDLLRE